MRLIHEQTRPCMMAILTAGQKEKFAQMPIPGPPGQGSRGSQMGGQNGGSGNPRGGGNRPAMQNNDQMQDEDHGRPVELIARDLGVTPEQFREAFEKVHPAAKGERPTQAQLHANHLVLAQALGVSVGKLDAVMDKYRPEGPNSPPRQEPD